MYLHAKAQTLAAFCSIALALGAAQSVAAAGVFYLCDMNTDNPKGWISPDIGIVFDAAGKVTIIDDVTQHFLGGPLKAKASRRGDKVRVTWNIANPVDSKGLRMATMRYTASLNTKNRSVSVIAKPVGLPQRWSGKGKCKAITK